jgi:hypothetical protein
VLAKFTDQSNSSQNHKKNLQDIHRYSNIKTKISEGMRPALLRGIWVASRAVETSPAFCLSRPVFPPSCQRPALSGDASTHLRQAGPVDSALE